MIDTLPSKLGNIRQAYLDTDQKALQLDEAASSGSTVIAVIQSGNQVTITSAGDSTAFVASYDGGSSASSAIISRSVKHKPADPQERVRIENAGGRVILPRPELGDLSSRVIIPTNQGDMALAMSRCMGDNDGKKMGYLSAEPSVVKTTIREPSFLFVSSDGVVDFLNIDELSRRIGKALKEGTLPQTCADVLNESKDLWAKETNGRYRDDMTLVVRRLS